MKKILLALLVSLGLQTQAQIWFPCDSMSVIGGSSQSQLQMEMPNINNFIYYWATTSTDGTLLGEDSMVTTHTVNNYNPTTTLPYDTIISCVSYDTSMNTCCIQWIWDGISWARMMMQQPYFCCDSITYWIDQSQGFNIGLDTSGIVHNPDSMTVYWGVCTGFATAGMCYADQGMYAYFPQVMTTDTIKVGYDVYLYENGVVEVCSREDWLVFDGTNWVLLNMNPTSINELTFNRINDGKIYDLLGREFKNYQSIPTGVIYIRDKQKFIKQ